jgi:hypothetical protein
MDGVLVISGCGKNCRRLMGIRPRASDRVYGDHPPGTASGDLASSASSAVGQFAST